MQTQTNYDQQGEEQLHPNSRHRPNPLESLCLAEVNLRKSAAPSGNLVPRRPGSHYLTQHRRARWSSRGRRELSLPLRSWGLRQTRGGSVSVFKAVYIDKREIKCACVGGSSNVPLGFVSLTENLMMIAMAIWMSIRMLWLA